jgi:hypothetical protein
MKAANKGSEIFDCNCWFGINYLNDDLSVNHKDLGRYINFLTEDQKVPRIFLSHYFSLFYDPLKGDDLLGDILSKNQDLSGIMVFPNFFISNKKEFEKYLTDKYDSGFRILRLYPGTHKYSIDLWAFDHFYSILNSCSYPVMINLEELDITGNKAIDWSILYHISKKFQKIPIIIDGGNTKELMFNNYFFQLLENTDNIYLDTHNLLAFNQIEELSNRFGSKRLIFGSYFPYYPYHLALDRITNSRLIEEDRASILSGNIKKMIRNIKIRS